MKRVHIALNGRNPRFKELSFDQRVAFIEYCKDLRQFEDPAADTFKKEAIQRNIRIKYHLKNILKLRNKS